MNTSPLKSLVSKALGAIGFAEESPSHERANRAHRPTVSSGEYRDAVLLPYLGCLRAIKERGRFSSATFERDCLGLVRRVFGHAHYAPPQTGSRRLLLEQTRHALGFRQAMLLPPGAPAEEIATRSHRWTFGLFVASMLSELRWADGWSTGSGSPDAADGLERSLRQWLAPESLAWLIEDALLIQHLQAFFSAPTGATVLHRLVRDGRRAALGQPEPAGKATEPPRDVDTLPATPTTPSDQRPIRAEALPPPPLAPAVAIVAEQPAMAPAPIPGPTHAPVQEPTAAPKPKPSASEWHEVQEPMAEVRAGSSDRTGGPSNSSAPLAQTITPAAPSVEFALAGLSGAPLAANFMQWLSQGIAHQSIPFNAADARVHFVSDGMVLVAPGIFQEFAAQHASGVVADITAFGKEVQKAVCAEGWHLRGPQNAHVHRFRVNQAGQSSSVVKAVIVQSPQRFITPLPAYNPAISRLM